ncbi:BTB/POZ protein [Lipomyces oligophaga]|uniref:BTB/POZ protein n=1 Tax=Lipomyces oligophaga TaxID=45792 RepID=UPI0034CD2F76
MAASGNIGSTEREYVLLVSSDGYEFSILRSAAMISGTLRGMLSESSNFVEARQNRVELHGISGVLLEKVCEYLYYNLKHQNNPGTFPSFDVPPEMALELLVTADYLDGKV